MRWTKTAALRLRSLFQVKRADSELDAELRFHLEKMVEENRSMGMSERHAREAALREFGGLTQLREEARDQRGLNLLYDLGRDVRLAFRQLRRSPGFAAVVILSLALGIGANTAIFTLAHAVLLQPLPVSHPEQLYRLGNTDNCCVIGGLQGDYSIFAYPFYLQLREHTPEFSQMAAFDGEPRKVSIRRIGSTEPAMPGRTEFVSGDYFATLGVGMAAGRPMASTDDLVGAPPVAVMSYREWEQHYAFDQSVLGANVSINGIAFTVIGVAARGFYGAEFRPDPPDYWLPIAAEPALGASSILGSLIARPDECWLDIIGRLRPGAHVAEAQTRVTAELQQWLVEHPEIAGDSRANLPQQRIVITPGGRGVTSFGDHLANGIYLLFAISGLLLLIACANIANLLLARGMAARAQTAIQLAIGASRRRLMLQALVGTLVLALAGGAGALLVANVGTRALLVLSFSNAAYVPVRPTATVPVLGFALTLSFLAAMAFGAAPAWLNTRGDPAAALHGAGRTARDPSSASRKVLVVLQVAFTLILLAGAGLFAATLRNLEQRRFGFEAQGRMMVTVDPATAGYSLGTLPSFYREIEEKLGRVPGVSGVTYSLYSPLEGYTWNDDVAVEGRRSSEYDSASWDRVGPRYFEVMGSRLLLGRTIGAEDTAASPHVAVVNEMFVRRYLPSVDPIGKHLGIGDTAHAFDYQIVGVVEDAIYSARRPPRPMFFIPFFQSPEYSRANDRAQSVRSNYIDAIVLRYSGATGEIEQAVRQALAEINPDLPVFRIQTLGQQVQSNFAIERNFAGISTLFSVLALVLAAIGLYGVMAYRVVQRTSEIGLRIALGSSRARVLRMVLREAALLLLIGISIGLPAALGAARLTASFLYGLQPGDPAVMASAIAVLAAVALLAALVPAHRASRVDPMTALRHE